MGIITGTTDKDGNLILEINAKKRLAKSRRFFGVILAGKGFVSYNIFVARP